MYDMSGLDNFEVRLGFPGVSEEEYEYGIFVFPVSTQLGGLEGNYDYSIDVQCGGGAVCSR